MNFVSESFLTQVPLSVMIDIPSRLIGAPSGCVAFGEGGQLTKAVRCSPCDGAHTCVFLSWRKC